MQLLFKERRRLAYRTKTERILDKVCGLEKIGQWDMWCVFGKGRSVAAAGVIWTRHANS